MTAFQPTRKRLSLGWPVAAIVLLVAAVTILLNRSDRSVAPDDDQTSGTQFTSDELVTIASLRNLGVAFLENAELDQAIDALTHLQQMLPDERLPLQNLAIARLLHIDPEADGHLDRSREPDRYTQAVDSARATVGRLVAAYPDDHVPRLLAGRVARVTGQTNEAIAHFRAAHELAPDSAAVAFELYEAIRDSRDDSLMPEAAEALTDAWQAASGNLAVFKERLVSLAREKAYQQRSDAPHFPAASVDLRDMFQAAATLLKPFARRISNFARVDVLELAEQGAAAVDQEDWNTVLRNASVIGNVITPEVATQNDRKRVQPHHLEFIVRDLSETFAQSHDLPAPSFPPLIDVSLERTGTVTDSLPDVQSVRIADMTLDGKQDIVTVDRSTIRVWSREEDAWSELFSASAGSGLRGVCLFDIDRDAADVRLETDGEAVIHAEADLDAIVYGASGMTVLHNELDSEAGQRRFVPVPQSPEFAALRNILTILPIDVDHDGDLDLLVSAEAGMSLWLNRDDSTFFDNSEFSMLPPADAGIDRMIAVDWDRNVSIDAVCLGNGTAGYLQNLLHGQLRWQEFDAGVPELDQAVSAALIDADGNFSWDLVAGGTDFVRLFPTSNPDAGITRFETAQEILGAPAAGLLTADIDNDGYLDLSVWKDRQLTVLRGGPQGQFQEIAGLSAELPSEIQSADAGDIDGDGDIDLVVACQESLELLMNHGGNTNHWIDLPVRAEAALETQRRSERVNLHGIGSLIELQAGTLYQPRVVTGPSTHFGLGQLESADTIRVLWTNGIPEHVVRPRHQQPIVLQQHLKGSCPYLYTWNGAAWTFYTDCLWAAPIGLQPVEGTLLPPREWEYLKIDGKALRARDGHYDLMLTEELWEIGYFDSVRLLAVDHPADIDIYSNEKVGPPDISEFRIHTVRTPLIPRAAHDQRGRDVLDLIAKQDDIWLQCWDRRIKQGLTEPHYLELDLGELSAPENITLFLTGWIRPTDTSLNVAITQRPDLDPTAPPALSVPDARGNWVTIRPQMGFPGGKTKTIAVDLTGLFPTSDYRVRISTTMEIYWDHIFFTVDESPGDVRISELPLESATLSWRGFSHRLPHSGNGLGPESYDFSQVSQRPHWPPLEGLLTGYGDVLPLITTTDRQQVTLGPGDALTLRFSAGDVSLPEGWTRDFILHNVGWDKDADLNTVFGQSVDPLPFAGMVGYPDISGRGDHPPSARQTRSQSRAAFWRYFFDPDQFTAETTWNSADTSPDRSEDGNHPRPAVRNSRARN